MSHLGWVTALYLVANHLTVKGHTVSRRRGVIIRTGTRHFDDLGGLARVMPFTFASATIAIAAMSGLPPLAGFGGKWLRLSAMMEKGWYGTGRDDSGLATLSASPTWSILSMRIFSGVAMRTSHLTEAPLALLIPQYLLVAGILAMSFFPKLLIEPISQAIDPQFASTLVWQGMSLEMIYGYWNPFPVMMLAVIVSAVLFGLFWLVRNAGWMRPGAARAGGTVSSWLYLQPHAAGRHGILGGLADATTSGGDNARE